MSTRRRAALLAAVIVAGVAGIGGAGCGGRASTVRLPAGARVLARGSPRYAVAFTADGRLVSIELEERFALVVRDPDGRARGRYDLGPAERDLPALAVAGGVAYVGGDDAQVRGLALADGVTVARWPMGAPVTALAVAGDALAIGDGAGALCVRRLADGALVQCVQLASRAIDAITVARATVVAASGAHRWALALPALGSVPIPAGDATALVATGREVRRGRTTVARLAGAVRAIAVGTDGRVAVAAWVARLDDPAIVVWPTAPTTPRRAP